MRVYLTGATGFIGTYVLRELVEKGHTVRCLLRNPEVELAVEGDRIERERGDVTDAASLRGSMRGCDAVIHLVGIIDEKPRQGITFKSIHDDGTRNVVQEACSESIETFIHISSNGAAEKSRSGYQSSKWASEQHVKRADYPHWTIFRPSIVFGDAGVDRIEFATRLLRQLIRPFPVLPVFGDGEYGIQPVYVGDVAKAFEQALSLPAAAKKAYCVAGRNRLSYRDALDVIAEGAGLKPRPKVPQPMWLVRTVVHAAGPTGLLPISPDQLEMLVRGNTCDSQDFHADFDLERVPFSPDTLSYLRRK